MKEAEQTLDMTREKHHKNRQRQKDIDAHDEAVRLRKLAAQREANLARLLAEKEERERARLAAILAARKVRPEPVETLFVAPVRPRRVVPREFSQGVGSRTHRTPPGTPSRQVRMPRLPWSERNFLGDQDVEPGQLASMRRRNPDFGRHGVKTTVEATIRTPSYYELYP